MPLHQSMTQHHVNRHFPPHTSQTARNKMISATLAGVSAKPPSQLRPNKGKVLDGPQLFTIPSLCAQVKEFISSELLAQLCALGDCSELMDESPEQRQHRKQVLRKHAALKEALAIVSNLSTSACSTMKTPSVDSALMQTPR